MNKRNLKDKLLDALLPVIEDTYTEQQVMLRRTGKSTLVLNDIFYKMIMKEKADKLAKNG